MVTELRTLGLIISQGVIKPDLFLETRVLWKCSAVGTFSARGWDTIFPKGLFYTELFGKQFTVNFGTFRRGGACNVLTYSSVSLCFTRPKTLSFGIKLLTG